MWNMCMDPVLREVQERGGEIVAYAYDLLLLVPGDSRTDCEVRAQSMTDVIAGPAEPSIKYRNLVRYLGVTLGPCFSIAQHIEITGAKASGFYQRLASVARAQWGISYGAMRHLYAGVFLPTMFYAVTAWGDVVTSTLALKLERMQRVALLRICRAYRTASTVSLQVCAGLLPLDLECIRWRLRAQIKRGASFEMYGVAFREGDNKRQALQRVESSLLALWQERWTTTSKGEVAKRFFPTIESRISKDFIELDHYVSQFLTGDGDLSYRLHDLKLAESPLCSCGADETVEHVLLKCGRLEAPRGELKEYMARVGIPWPPDLSALVETKEVYGIFRGTCRALLLEKRRLDVEERDRANPAQYERNRRFGHLVHALGRAAGGAKLPSVGLCLNASKAVSFLVKGGNDISRSLQCVRTCKKKKRKDQKEKKRFQRFKGRAASAEQLVPRASGFARAYCSQAMCMDLYEKRHRLLCRPHSESERRAEGYVGASNAYGLVLFVRRALTGGCVRASARTQDPGPR
ncbi:unnamed protein product [Trichogramma brassicae]|uniref:Reverse transcriptase domain-containing protein n=1 Tax=Trichogramma brassicae TaxID=86971 RepID=A0A6H5J6J2_9HYME|nr:unnamed protein product [Trichogramma brassicae]